MRSILARITAVSFITTAIVVTILTAVANYQISAHFSKYIFMYHGSKMHGMMNGMMGNMDMSTMMGGPELAFLSSLKHSLLAAAILMLVIGAAISYYLARSIAGPVIQLNKAVNAVAGGNLDTKVNVARQDEIGQLAAAFNAMTASLKNNTLLRQHLLAGVAHELRTPLAVLKANLEGIIDGVIQPDREQVGSLIEEVDRLSKVVADLTDLSLLEAGQLKLEFSLFNLNYVLEQVVARLRPLADAKHIALTLKLPDNPIMQWADADRISQIVYNLVINAIKYTKEKGSILVSAESMKDGDTKICVTDNGIGIPPEKIAYIFEYFYRVEPSRSKQSGGTGLGLAIVRELTATHHGKVTLESKPGEGSTFTVVLPNKNS